MQARRGKLRGLPAVTQHGSIWMRCRVPSWAIAPAQAPPSSPLPAAASSPMGDGVWCWFVLLGFCVFLVVFWLFGFFLLHRKCLHLPLRHPPSPVPCCSPPPSEHLAPLPRGTPRVWGAGRVPTPLRGQGEALGKPRGRAARPGCLPPPPRSQPLAGRHCKTPEEGKQKEDGAHRGAVMGRRGKGGGVWRPGPHSWNLGCFTGKMTALLSSPGWEGSARCRMGLAAGPEQAGFPAPPGSPPLPAWASPGLCSGTTASVLSIELKSCIFSSFWLLCIK